MLYISVPMLWYFRSWSTTQVNAILNGPEMLLRTVQSISSDRLSGNGILRVGWAACCDC